MLERLAGTASGVRGGRGGDRPRARWPTQRTGRDPWAAGEASDQAWLRRPAASLAREALQHALLFPAARALARPRIIGAEGLMHTPQPAVLAPNHESDLDTPLVLLALPRAWRSRTVVGAASDRFYRDRLHAVSAGLWINTFPFDRGGGQRRGLAAPHRSCVTTTTSCSTRRPPAAQGLRASGSESPSCASPPVRP